MPFKRTENDAILKCAHGIDLIAQARNYGSSERLWDHLSRRIEIAPMN